jgi:hypothetical protein
MRATLLGLPAELRNRIYEYALTDPSSIGLRFRAYLIVNDTICKPVLLGANGEQFNALKHVCRQLRAETDGLDLAYNVVRIEQVDRDSWAPTKRLFSMMGPNMRSSRPLNIMLVEHPEGEREPWSDTLALADWCALHDNINTGYVLSGFCCFDDKFPERWRFPKDFTAWTPEDKENASLRMARFFGCGVFFTVAFRGSNRCSESEWSRLCLDTLLGLSREQLRTGAESCRQGWDIDNHGRVRNLTFLPIEGEVDELMIRALVCLANKSDVGDEITKEWEHMVRTWVKDGI